MRQPFYMEYIMRLFIAIQFTDEIKKPLMEMMHALKKNGVKGNYVPLQNLHMTLAFIGECKDAEAVKAAMRTVKVKPFRVTLSEAGCFGDLLWAGAKGNQGLNGTAKAVRDALDAAGIAYDRQKFVPHVTLIRKMSGNWKSVKVPKAEMMVRKISLMKSEQKNGKMVYTEFFFC